MKTDTFENPGPKGYPTVCPYLMVESVEKQTEFLQNVFQAKVLEALREPDGSVAHGEVQIGNAVIMMGKASEDYPARHSMNYVFVTDVDAMYERALSLGATSLMEPGDRFYGNREGGFADLQGNQWWIAQPIQNLSQEEMEKRLAERG